MAPYSESRVESQHLCFEEEQVEDVLKFAIKEEIKVEPSEGF